MLAAALLSGAQIGSAVGADDKLLPASESAILAGAKACVGATIDPAGQDARLTGWPSVVGNDADKDPSGSARRVAAKDGVSLTVKSGIDGGCVVRAKTDPSFTDLTFYTDLSREVGVPVDAKRSVVTLPNGELLVAQVGGGYVQLVVANPNGKYAKKYSKGN